MADNSESKDLHVVFGTGAVGMAVINALVEKERRVRAVNRRGQANVPPGVEVCAGDVIDKAATQTLCEGAAVVYNCTNPPYTQWPELFPKLQAGVLAGATSAGAKLVAMDNLYMYGPTDGQPLTEDLPYAAETRKGRTRATMAQELLNAHQAGVVQVAIGRASDFFGPRAESAVGERVFYPALSGKPAQVLGNPDLPHTYSYIPDIGRGLVILGEEEQALGRAWHLPAPKTVTTRQFLELIYNETNQPLKIQSMPKLLLKGMALFNPMMRELDEMLYEFEEPFIMDHSRFDAAFGNHATPLQEAIKQTVAWYRANPKAK